MSADLLRRAAAKIREVSGAASPGPWEADVEVRGDCVVWGPNGRFILNAQAEPHWIEFPEGWPTKRSVAFDVDRRDTHHIAMWSPDVAEPVAEFLDHEAEMHDGEEWPVFCDSAPRALVIARRILGEDA
jgi:hypothetical protein